MNIKEGTFEAKDCRFGIVVSRFNELVTSKLLASSIETLQEAGAHEKDIEVVKVPGAFEIPFMARQLAQSRRFDAIICIGAIIRGDTPHFDYICTETSRGIAQAGWDFGIPVIFGVLTTNTVEQAVERTEVPDMNRGISAARSAIEMVSLMKQCHLSHRQAPGFRGMLDKPEQSS
ncbi:MAG: 6,7-dimethyl-8-ribityllumazine synthase [Nitrospirales bacterium]|nr:6,7-dimethyl-8-ribityllumazine synthase [Nitrospirales bacterium]